MSHVVCVPHHSIQKQDLSFSCEMGDGCAEKSEILKKGKFIEETLIIFRLII